VRVGSWEAFAGEHEPVCLATLALGANEFPVEHGRDIDMNRGFVLLGAVGLLFSTVSLGGQDPMQYGVKHLKVLAEDDKVRVLEYSPKKGDRTPMHSHPSMKTGETLLRAPVTHADEALDDPDAILVELKTPRF
jgi:hypothetical protein